MDLFALQEKYKSVPNELKTLKRWICFKVEGREDGKTTKRPYNALNGKFARVNDDLTWSNFNIALNGCIKYHCDGLGFVLGNGIFGIDLDNHADKDGNIAMNDEEFKTFSEQFISALDSYTEYSQSGKGVHIICSGTLPEGSRRKGCVEMYDSGRFFAFTGNVIRNTTINDRTEQVKPLWEKFVQSEYQANRPAIQPRQPKPNALMLSDDEIIKAAYASKGGEKFYAYYHDGDISMDNNDQSAADMSFCNLLAWWCNSDKAQMDRIFRSSALMRDKWDQYRGSQTYGEITLTKAIADCVGGYACDRSFANGDTKGLTPQRNYTIRNEVSSATKDNGMNLNADGEPIFRIKKIFRHYTLTDTGNAERFYDYFGDCFKYNTTDECFMFWTGKTWIKDNGDIIIRKYADKMISILQSEEDEVAGQIEEAKRQGENEKAAQYTVLLAEMIKNKKKISNKSGKDSMLSELRHIKKMAVENSIFDQDIYLLNTDSGIVDLRTGEIKPFDKEFYMSKNTNTEVSFEEPTEWLKFIRSIFDCGNIVETEEIVDSIQTFLGYSLSGSTKEQVMFMLYGDGSNGKSTLTEQIARILGDYATSIPSSVLMSQKNGNSVAVEYSLARLRGVRFVATGETDEGAKFAESQVKIITGSDKIQAQFKYGQPFTYYPHYKIWMSTNNLPNIKGTDNGIWRRLETVPFLRTFTDKEKDKFLPEKLEKESAKILGWCIQGFIKYWQLGNFIRCPRLQELKDRYKYKMDMVEQFLVNECTYATNAKVECRELYSHFKSWFKNNTEYEMRESMFRDRLTKKGIKIQSMSNGVRMYVGIRLNGANIGGHDIW